MIHHVGGYEVECVITQPSSVVHRACTSIQKRGAPQALTQWTTYDARNRTWYKEEMARAGETGWSSVYDFSTSRALGVTRTAKLRRHDERVAVEEHPDHRREEREAAEGLATAEEQG